MKTQKIFNFKFKKTKNFENFYLNNTNIMAFNGIINNDNSNLFLVGPKKSGKTTIGEIWSQNNNATKYNNNFENIILNRCNILIDDLDLNHDEENLFHLINHCFLNKLKILIISDKYINDYNFKYKDIISRLKTFEIYEIEDPDDDMLLNILTKLLIDKQFIINKPEIVNYILKRAGRSYKDMLNIVTKLDTLSLEKKRQLTIPLIKEIL